MENILRKEIDSKRGKEKRVVKDMIEIYCKGHNHLHTPCKSCSELIKYVDKRIDNCPFMETKTYCNNCKVHCYKKDMREKIKEVMKYSGPRMIFAHPKMVVDHMYQGVKHKNKEKRNKREERN